MLGLEGAILIPLLLLGSAVILYFGLISTRARQLERREREEREERASSEREAAARGAS